MKKNIGSIVFLWALLLTAGCAKEVGPFDPNNPVSDPVFTMSAIIGSDSIQMAAGPNGYRMETSKMPLGSMPGHVLINGIMHDPLCPNCGPSMELKLWHRPDSPQEFNSDHAFAPGSVSLGLPPQSSTSKTFEFVFNANPGQGMPQQVLWDFGDGQTGQGFQVTHTFQTGIGMPILADVLCTALYPGGCSVFFINSFSLAQNTYLNVDVGIIANIASVNVSPPLSPAEGLLIFDMGDGSPPYSDFSFVHQYSGTGQYFISAYAFLGTDSIPLLQYQSIINAGTPSCNGSIQYTEIQDSMAPLPREAEILYHDGNGNSYSSRSNHSSTEQFINILHHQAYKPNEHGDLVYEVEIEAACWLYEINGTDSIRMEGALFNWGFPY